MKKKTKNRRAGFIKRLSKRFSYVVEKSDVFILKITNVKLQEKHSTIMLKMFYIMEYNIQKEKELILLISLQT